MNLEQNEDVEDEAESSKSKLRRCGICNQEGHNARTCSNKRKSNDNNTDKEDHEETSRKKLRKALNTGIYVCKFELYDFMFIDFSFI